MELPGLFCRFFARTLPEALLSSFLKNANADQRAEEKNRKRERLDIRARFKLLKVLHLAKVYA